MPWLPPPFPAAAAACSWAKLSGADGILVPGGFGTRGVEGKILAANYARCNKVPYLGICLGMQVRPRQGQERKARARVRAPASSGVAACPLLSACLFTTEL